MTIVKIIEPRYRDMTVLLARFKLPPGQDVNVQILKGARKGLYLAKSVDICNSPVESMKTRRGSTISIRAVPLEKLVRIE